MKLRINVEGRAYEVEIDVVENGLDGIGGEVPARRLQIPEAVLRPRPPQRMREDDFCRSPIAGRVTAVCGATGQNVRRNEPVIVIEAMKMEIGVGPAVDGTVKAIRVEPGDAVRSGQVLFELG